MYSSKFFNITVEVNAAEIQFFKRATFPKGIEIAIEATTITQVQRPKQISVFEHRHVSGYFCTSEQ